MLIPLLLCSIFLHPAEQLKDRFKAPPGYSRQLTKTGSFEAFLQELPLKPKGSHTLNYRSEIAATDEFTAAVIDLDPGRKDLQQCADAIIRLRSEYLWKQKRYPELAFNFTSGFRCEYKKFAAGYRYSNGHWLKSAKPDHSYQGFQSWLELVYTYAGTISLEKELKKSGQLKIGNVFIRGASPGHCFIITDLCVNKKDTLFQIAQSYMPAQNIQILKNGDSPWFKLGTISDVPYAGLIERKYLKAFD